MTPGTSIELLSSPPPSKRLRPDATTSAARRHLSGLWRQTKRDSCGRFMSKVEVASSFARRVQDAARLISAWSLQNSSPSPLDASDSARMSFAESAAHRSGRIRQELRGHMYIGPQ